MKEHLGTLGGQGHFLYLTTLPTPMPAPPALYFLVDPGVKLTPSPSETVEALMFL